MAGDKRSRNRGDDGGSRGAKRAKGGRASGGAGGIVGKLFFFLVLASLGYLAWQVPVGGRTTVQHLARFIDRHQPDPTAPVVPPRPPAKPRPIDAEAEAQQEVAPAPPATAKKSVPPSSIEARPKAPPAPTGEEQLTASDRAAVDRLLH